MRTLVLLVLVVLTVVLVAEAKRSRRPKKDYAKICPGLLVKQNKKLSLTKDEKRTLRTCVALARRRSSQARRKCTNAQRQQGMYKKKKKPVPKKVQVIYTSADCKRFFAEEAKKAKELKTKCLAIKAKKDKNVKLSKTEKRMVRKCRSHLRKKRPQRNKSGKRYRVCMKIIKKIAMKKKKITAEEENFMKTSPKCNERLAAFKKCSAAAAAKAAVAAKSTKKTRGRKRKSRKRTNRKNNWTRCYYKLWKRESCKNVVYEAHRNVKVPDGSYCRVKSADDNAKCTAFCKPETKSKTAVSRKNRRKQKQKQTVRPVRNCKGVTYVSSTKMCLVCTVISMPRQKKGQKTKFAGLPCTTCSTTLKVCKDKILKY